MDSTVTGANPSVYRRDGGDEIALGAVLAKAGEGTIHCVVDQSDVVAKVFHADLSGLPTKLNKVAAMARAHPRGATQDDGFTVLTWPTDLIRRNGQPAGYLMPRIDTTKAVEIHALSNPAHRANPLPNAPQWPAHATWSHLLTVAANLCLAVEVVHRVDAVIGDFQERNILVTDTCRVTLVDCDSMQFTDVSGNSYLCAVGRPEFTAPELAGTNLSTQARSKNSDLFALAVHIHLLLMAGNHPFQRGDWVGPGEQPSAVELAKSGDWAGGRNSRLHTHPLAPPVTFLPNTIQELFARAFTVGPTNPAARPTAAEWRAALLAVAVSSCTPGRHQIPIGTSACPWCAIDAERARRKAATPVDRQTVHKVVEPNGNPQSADVRPKTTRHAVVAANSAPKVAPPTQPARSQKNRPPFRAGSGQIKPKPPPPKDAGEMLAQIGGGVARALAVLMAICILAAIVGVSIAVATYLSSH